MKNLIYISFISFFLFSCSSPKNTAKDFLEAMNSSEFETAMTLVTEESQPILYSLINEQTKDIPKVNIEIKECSSINNEDQVVCVYIISNDDGDSLEKIMTLIKENNQWKVDLTNQ